MIPRSRALRGRRVLVSGSVLVLLGITMAGVLVKVRDELAVQADARQARRLVADRKFEDAYQPLERWLEGAAQLGRGLVPDRQGNVRRQRDGPGIRGARACSVPGIPASRRSSVKRQSSCPSWEGTTKPSRYCGGSCSLRRSRIRRQTRHWRSVTSRRFSLARPRALSRSGFMTLLAM